MAHIARIRSCCKSNISPIWRSTINKITFKPSQYIQYWKCQFSSSSFKYKRRYHKAVSTSKKWTAGKKVLIGVAGLCGVGLLAKLLGSESDNLETYVDSKSKDNDGLIRYNGVWLPKVMFGSKLWPEIQNFAVHSDDIFVVSYPKSGTTWVQEIVHLLLNIDNIEQASKESLGTVFPYLEFPYPGLKAVIEKPRPRTIKTHLPFEVLPSDIHRAKPKIIYIARNVKDVSVSYFHFHRSMTQVSYSGSFEDFLENFLLGQVSYDSWWKHVKSFWDKRKEDNVHFVRYEDLKQNTSKEIEAIANFLNIQVTETQLKRVAEKCTFTQMRDNPATNNSWMKEYGLWNNVKDADMKFMRKGIVGDWKRYYSADLAKIIDAKTEKELSPVGLSFNDGG